MRLKPDVPADAYQDILAPRMLLPIVAANARMFEEGALLEAPATAA